MSKRKVKKCKMPKHFAIELKRRRARRNFTQEQAADYIGVSLKTYVNWEQARNVPDALKRRAVLARI